MACLSASAFGQYRSRQRRSPTLIDVPRSSPAAPPVDVHRWRTPAARKVGPQLGQSRRIGVLLADVICDSGTARRVGDAVAFVGATSNPVSGTCGPIK